MRTLLLVGLIASFALAGCSNDAGGQSAAQDGNLAYNGASPGSHSSKFECDGGGTVSLGANLGSGSVTVTVKDSAGKTVYSKTASTVGQTSDNKEVQGTGGQWTVSATRGSGFTGQYGIDVSC
jgi:hypothetical protein